MLRQLPNNYSRSMLVELLEAQNFSKLYDFLYLPIDFTTNACMGYAFVNLVSNADALRFKAAFDGFRDWVIPSRKVCGVCWSHPNQGFQSNIDRYRNSPVMHQSVPDEFKPILLSDGVRVPFPPPLKKLRVPRMRVANPTTGHRFVTNVAHLTV